MSHDIIIVLTFSDSTLPNAVLHEGLISSCTSDETDQRIIRHAINLADKGYQHIYIRSADTDVLTLPIAHSETIISKVLNVLNANCGSGKFCNVKSISVQLGAEVCIYCWDTALSFCKHGKCEFFDTWMNLNKVNTELSELFKCLSRMRDQIKITDFDLLGSSLMRVYKQNSKRDVSLDIFRTNEFSKCTSFDPCNLVLS